MSDMQYVQVKFPESEYPSFARVVAIGRNPEYQGPLSDLMGVVDEPE